MDCRARYRAAALPGLGPSCEESGLRAAGGGKAGSRGAEDDWYRECLSGLSPRDLLPGAECFLAGCRGLGLKLALASASASAKDVLRATGIGGSFDAFTGIAGAEAAALVAELGARSAARKGR
jgi:beta-phosphoglucomutase-like phosphatase (HAD superfamily)